MRRRFVSYAYLSDVVIPEGSVFDPQAAGGDRLGFEAVLQLSDAKSVKGMMIMVAGGRSSALEVRGCDRVELEELYLIGGQHCAAAIKGGSRAVWLRGVTIDEVTSRWCDIEIGGWDESRERTHEVVITRAKRMDGEKVRVVVGHADWPAIEGSRARICYGRSFILKAWLWWRRLVT